MKRYFFDTFNGIGHERDGTGSEFRSMAEVRRHAGDILSEIIRVELPVSPAGAVEINVRDGTDTVIFSAKAIFESFA